MATQPDAAPGADAARTAARLTRQVEVALAEADLTGAQYRVLMLLAGEARGASRLASILAVSPPSVTGVVDVLVTRGLVARESVPGDRRQVSHSLTPSGTKALRAADDAVAGRLAKLLESAPAAVRRRALDGLSAWQVALDLCSGHGPTAVPAARAKAAGGRTA